LKLVLVLLIRKGLILTCCKKTYELWLDQIPLKDTYCKEHLGKQVDNSHSVICLNLPISVIENHWLMLKEFNKMVIRISLSQLHSLEIINSKSIHYIWYFQTITKGKPEIVDYVIRYSLHKNLTFSDHRPKNTITGGKLIEHLRIGFFLFIMSISNL
jgi:hypothetical protein